jgi:hypothetical protein
LRHFLLPFGLFALGDEFAEIAGIIATEGFFQSDRERAVCGEANKHADPRDRLQESPMQPERKSEHQNHDGPGQSRTHDANLKSVARYVKGNYCKLAASRDSPGRHGARASRAEAGTARVDGGCIALGERYPAGQGSINLPVLADLSGINIIG